MSDDVIDIAERRQRSEAQILRSMQAERERVERREHLKFLVWYMAAAIALVALAAWVSIWGRR